MLKELHTAALGLLNTQTRLEVTANNIANAGTTAFKRAGVFERNLVDAKASLFNHAGKLEQDDPPIGSYTDWKAGSSNNTNNPLDIAIDGSGFFTLRSADGEETLTRNGSFKLTPDGFLVSHDGKYVLGTNNEAIRIPDYTSIDGSDGKTERKAVDVTIANTGEIYANDEPVATLKIVDAEDYSQLVRLSSQDFLPDVDAGLVNVPQDNVNIKQGWLEGSNVDIINEMVTMIELQRAFEAGSKVIQTNDSTLDKSMQVAKFGYY